MKISLTPDFGGTPFKRNIIPLSNPSGGDAPILVWRSNHTKPNVNSACASNIRSLICAVFSYGFPATIPLTISSPKVPPAA